MDKLPSKPKKPKGLTREELITLDKDELVEKVIQLTAHNVQLKNILSKTLSEKADTENNTTKKKPSKSFDFSKSHTRRVLLRLTYLGWRYHGLAVQEHTTLTVEHQLFLALTKACLIESRETAQYHRCGRTDKGVSAFGQVRSKKLPSETDEVNNNSCAACEHCQAPISAHEAVLREGYSYHKDCCKCYVCSETNLQNAEVFKGVIFCASCSRRIFQGCSTARETRTNRVPATRYVSRNPPSRLKDEDGSLDHNSNSMKKESIEMGVTTEFTQKLIKHLTCPAVECKVTLPCTTVTRNPTRVPASVRVKKHQKSPKQSEKVWSDLRIAELGASTEIATMALRKHSTDMPRIVNKRSSGKLKKSFSESVSGSAFMDLTEDSLEEWLETTRANRRTMRMQRASLLDKPVGSILKMPYRFFKNKILERSSMVSVLISDDGAAREKYINKFKTLFHEEMTEHHRRAVRKLYPTINRKNPPYRLGWLHMETAISRSSINLAAKAYRNQTNTHRCKHFKRSHSYRCLRSHVMRLAGPTKSQLAAYRSSFKNKLVKPVVKKIFRNYRCDPAITMSAACGNSVSAK